MSPAQLAQLRTMPAWEITRRYLPLLTSRAITQLQYDWLLTQCRKEPAAAPPTTPPEPPTGATQVERLLKLLSDGLWHDTPEILASVYGAAHLGIARIASRVSDLRTAGHHIDSRRKSGTIHEYRMAV